MRYVEFRKKNVNLAITLTPAGRDFIAEAVAEGKNICSDAFMDDLFEHPLCNGWNRVKPEELAALTSSPIVTDDFQRDNHGKLVKVGRVYWFPNYQIESPVETLRDAGEVEFTGVD